MTAKIIRYRVGALRRAGFLLAALAMLAGPQALAESVRTPPSHSTFGAYLAGKHAIGNFAIADAARFYARVLAVDPENRQLLARTLYLMVAAGRNAEAVGLARRLVALQPNSRLANFVLALHAASAGRYPEAERRLTKLPKRGANRVLLPLLRGWIAYASGRRETALERVDEIADLRGFGNFHILHTGLMLEMSGRTEKAGARYAVALRKGKRAGLRMIYAVGVFYERSNQRAKAIALYRGYLKSRPQSAAIEFALQRALAKRRPPAFARNPGEAMAEALFDGASVLARGRGVRRSLMLARLALFMRPRFAPAQVLIGNILERQNQREAALALYRQVPPGSPLAWTARLAAANILDELKRTDEAIGLLERMARERPRRWDAPMALGDILRGRERFAEAAKAYDRAVARIPKLQSRHWGVLYARGIALERSKNWGRAEKDFLKALEFRPNQPFVLNYLGYSWVERGIQLTRARKMIEKAVALRRNDGYITDSLGWVLYRMGKYREAVRHLERAVELRPHDPTINDHLGDAYWRVGRKTEARVQWRRALSFEPAKDQVTIIKQKIERGLKKAGKPGRKL
ncbi:MAG: tetratricopeptide repeat protein [Alphaproteobacteria bacterium]